MRNRSLYASLVSLFCFVVLMIVTPAIPQSQEYHNFADHRKFFGIPNALNVISNFPFLVIGLVGLVLLYHGNYFRLSLQGEIWGWTCFYVGVAAVAVGSSYYHLKPDDARLVWDRLPMTVAFTSIIAIFIIERIDERKGTVSIIPLLLAGIISIVYWRQAHWFYLLAKVLEATDEVIYGWTHHIVSGHTLKHLAAAMVPVFLTFMLAKRNVEPERQNLLKTWRVSWMKFREGNSNIGIYSYSYAGVPVVET
ncbi:hypothetical protein V8G54_023129 [Vigna mungo]|uniref:Ceramidase n=1 Tax=Vigna mungo TaxID=3915 RepID=A0AAQ3N4U5_VIGMU